jgi:threonine dehydrogenase-like Zn-dependent dehydrogenase
MEQVAGVYRGGVVTLEGSVNWPEGTHVLVLHLPETWSVPLNQGHMGHVIIAGYGLAGRFVADVFRRHEMPFVVVERNPKTVEVQRELGASIIEGDIRDANVLQEAGVDRAAVLALTIPDEKAVLEATQIARKANPNIYIVARTQYASVGLQAARLGADEVVQAEYAVAMQFYQSFLRKLTGKGTDFSFPKPSQETR